MKRSLKFLNFKQKFYTRVKTVPLTDDLVEGLSAADMSRLKSMYLYDFYDTIKKLTGEMTCINDKKGIQRTVVFDYYSAIGTQIKNVIFLQKKLIRHHGEITRQLTYTIAENEDIISGEEDT